MTVGPHPVGHGPGCFRDVEQVRVCLRLATRSLSMWGFSAWRMAHPYTMRPVGLEHGGAGSKLTWLCNLHVEGFDSGHGRRGGWGSG